ncbi:cupin domain-containing protein [Hydrogenimonas sp.]
MAKVERTGITDKKRIEEILKSEGCFDIFVWSDHAGTRYGEHTHPHDEVRWVLSGALQIIEKGRTITLSAGDRLDSEANTPHSAYVPEDVAYVCASKEPST